MAKLLKDFSLEKYNLRLRLVNEDDAEFILSLRANPDRTKYMVTLDNDIESQKKWIREYKLREKEGIDYYFIYSKLDGEQIGLNRVSHIDYINKVGKFSSFIAVKGLKYEAVIMSLIRLEIAFNILKLNCVKGEVGVNNKNAIRILELFNFEFIDNGTDFYNMSLKKDAFLRSYNNPTLIKMLKLDGK